MKSSKGIAGKAKVLRSEAERKVLKKHSDRNFSHTGKDLKELIHELQVYQVELEMQNDELQTSHEALEKEKQRFMSFFDLAPVGYFILSKSAIIQKCNTTGRHLLGFGKASIIGTRFQSYIIKEDHEKFYSFIKMMIRENGSHSCLLGIGTKKDIKYVQAAGSIVVDEIAGISNYYIALIDVTEKRKSEKALRETSDLLHMALKASRTGTWNLDPSTGKVHMNSFAASIFGISEHSNDGKYERIINAIHPEEQKAVDNAIRLAIRKNTDLNIQFRLKQKPGVPDTYLEARGHNTETDGKERYFAGIIMDVTLKKQMEEETRLLRKEREKNILRTIIETQETERSRISSAIHDSLGQLLYATNLTLEKCLVTDPCIDSARRLIGQAVKEARNIAFELAPSILSDYGLIVALKEMISRLEASGLRFTLKSDGFETRLPLAVETLIFRVIQELINNIIKHSSASECRIELAKKGKIVHLTISDNGVGFNVHKGHSKGSGLSSIANRLMMYDGNMDIKSSKKTGTNITIHLRVE
jgi:PAS domain S-box-containing protein